MFPSRSLPSTDLHGANAGHVSERWFQCNGHLGYDTSNISTKCTNHWKHLETLKAWFRPALKSNSMPLVTPPFVFNKHILVTSPIVRFVFDPKTVPRSASLICPGTIPLIHIWVHQIWLRLVAFEVEALVLDWDTDFAVVSLRIGYSR